MSLDPHCLFLPSCPLHMCFNFPPTPIFLALLLTGRQHTALLAPAASGRSTNARTLTLLWPCSPAVPPSLPPFVLHRHKALVNELQQSKAEVGSGVLKDLMALCDPLPFWARSTRTGRCHTRSPLSDGSPEYTALKAAMQRAQ